MIDITRKAVESVYREESRRVLATLIRLLGDFELAEEALHDAFMAALEQWPRGGIPDNPRPWLVSVGRFRAIDRLRQRARYDKSLIKLAHVLEEYTDDSVDPEMENLEDDRLRLIFICCHPALPHDARVALTLREVCGLTTEEIAHAFIIPPPTLAQRIVRAKAKIREARIPYEVPTQNELPERLDTVLQVLYLVFNEGYSASFGETLTRADLSCEAIRLTRLLHELLTDPEVMGLLALMLLHESRRGARATPEGEVRLLDDQDRSLWNQDYIKEGIGLVESALSSSRFGLYTLQAAIAAIHAEAQEPSDTDWNQIVGLYDVLLRATASPVIELNRAVAIAMRDGSQVGVDLIEAILNKGELTNYQPAHTALADLYRRLNKRPEACAAYLRALELTHQKPQRRFIQRRLGELNAAN